MCEEAGIENTVILFAPQNAKINQKHDLLVRELSDLINQPSPVPSHHSMENNSRMVITEKLNMQSFQAHLAGMRWLLH